MAPDDRRSRFTAQYRSTIAPRLGFGRRPALLIVDFARGWTDPASPMAIDLDAAVEAAAALLQRARRLSVPAFFTTVAYQAHEVPANVLARKSPGVSCMHVGSRWTELDARLPVAQGDVILVKQHASPFFGTDLAAQLAERQIDTLLICGCVTSGCVRAAAVDAAQHDFRPMVVRDAVGDRSALAHEANLIDIDQRYGDVVSLEEAVDYLAALDRRVGA